MRPILPGNDGVGNDDAVNGCAAGCATGAPRSRATHVHRDVWQG
jgi:hypothetical protein